MGAPDVSAIRTHIDATVNNTAVSPEQRSRDLRGLRADLSTLVGQIDTYLGAIDLKRSGEVVGRAREAVVAREQADVREELEREGRVDGERLDKIGVLSHEQLDEFAEDGTLAAELEIRSRTRREE